MSVYLETTAPRDWGFYALFGYPYLEGARNICAGLPCFDAKRSENAPTLQDPPSLLGRVTHLVLGAFLLIPLLNTIVFIFLRIFCAQPIFEETTRIIPTPRTPPPSPTTSSAKDERAEKIAQLNLKRTPLCQELLSLNSDDPRRNELSRQIQTLEAEAAQLIKRKPTEEVEYHLAQARKKSLSLTHLDGKITSAPENRTRKKIRVGDVKAEFTQVGGLSQGQGANHLCGYYALFFMLQAATGKEFTDRTTFQPLLEKWLKLIAIKRSAALFSNRRTEEIPYGLVISVKGPNRDDLQYLINACEELAPLRETPGCFVLEMDEYFEKKCFSEPIKLIGKSAKDNKNPDGFPLYFILKNTDIHYYFIYSKEPGKFTFVHSLNYSVLNPMFFSHETFSNLVKALSGQDTPLQLKW